ncbi:MAG: hypothetical protein R3C19_11820 [Planctomycetaceae bacterium]
MAFFAVAAVGYFGVYDAVMLAIAAAACLPTWRPYILLLALSVQDSPGQSPKSLYVTVAGIAALMLLDGMISRRSARNTRIQSTELWRLMGVGAVVVVYGAVSSFYQHRYGLHEQSAYRPWWLVSLLMFVMMCTGWLAYREMIVDRLFRTRLSTVCACVIVHVLLIGGLQTVLGPSFGASPQGAQEMLSQNQLIDPSERGMARLTGPFDSPNMLAMVPALFMLLFLGAQQGRQVSPIFIAGFLVVGFTVALLGAARTMFVFYASAGAALLWTRSRSRAMLMMVVSLPLLLMIDIPWGDMLRLIRLENFQSFGYRGIFWEAVIFGMEGKDWLFGMGVTHFPVFFEAHTGMPAADPHNWILSVFGMFGVAGLVFYVYLAWRLGRQYLTSCGRYRAIVICLVLMYYFRDLSNMPYLLNNHPVTCLNWIVLGVALQRERDSIEEQLPC